MPNLGFKTDYQILKRKAKHCEECHQTGNNYNLNTDSAVCNISV